MGRKWLRPGTSRDELVWKLLRDHFGPDAAQQLSIAERKFPVRVKADLQGAVDKIFGAGAQVVRFTGVRKAYDHEGLDLAGLMASNDPNPAIVCPPQYEEIDIGEDRPTRCLQSGLWLLGNGPSRHAVLLAASKRHGSSDGVRFQIAATNDEQGRQIVETFFRSLESYVADARSYRGKVLSLEREYNYAGLASAIKVHKLASVGADQVILPKKTLDLLDRNVIQFVQRRPRLAELKQATKKGLLFYGPPGTGKSHTIQYLAGALKGHTTLLITSEQVGLLDEYMVLARLLQPSVVVIEDVDLIARDRTHMHGPCEEALLNKLLNEMDGLRENADILFILTTNRPEELEAALASRPGRVDQAIEFPLPDEQGRKKLVHLYAGGVQMSDDVISALVRRTENVSAAFIKELMRRSVQFHLERHDSPSIELPDVELALDEMLFSGGTLNLKLLGGNLNGGGVR